MWPHKTWHSWHSPRRHTPMKTHERTVSPPISVFPEVMSVWFNAGEIYRAAVLKDPQQLVSAAKMQSMPAVSWKSFYSSSLSETDLEQRHLVQMNEPVSLNNSFPPTEGVLGLGRGGTSSHCFICFQFLGIEMCKTCTMWWLLVFIRAQRGQQHNEQTKLEGERRYRALEELILHFMYLNPENKPELMWGLCLLI